MGYYSIILYIISFMVYYSILWYIMGYSGILGCDWIPQASNKFSPATRFLKGSFQESRDPSVDHPKIQSL